ncbi:hypothetical protein Tsubulata_010801 [Turnera subulata]|uniref:Uncharacterized protein n=1 Tax=Turnera subulata TaxID=218843 RepID=A0A9Q0FC39_9ROSI|nr:hypothetical protein Tsubulata_010801 [Turnera subulata]
MEFAMGSGGGGLAGDDQQEASNSPRGKKVYHRHTTHQIQRLEAFFKECPHPDENQRRHLSRELGLEPKQIKFWFQNKRTQAKAQHERTDNSVLRAENERIRCENLAIREALKNVICPACGGPPFGEEERKRSLQKLQLENSQLKEEASLHEKVSNLLAKYIGKPISQIDTTIPPQGPPFELMPASLPPMQHMGGSALDLELNAGSESNIPLAYSVKGIPEMEKALMSETAAGAMDELIKLLQINEPLWTKSPSDGVYILHCDNYDKLFPRVGHFKSSSARVESSKDFTIVPMKAMSLVDGFLDSNKWTDFFPTIVTNAKTIQTLKRGAVGNRNGCLQLMYQQLHILSPLVPPREFYLLRHCQQIESGIWVIADVSYDCWKENPSTSRSWRLPSGCMIQDMPNGCSKAKHVEVDDKTQTHRLYRDLICGNSAYGAERWIMTLQRMCERSSYSARETSPPRELGNGVITSPDGRNSILKLAHRMVKNFCASLSMTGKLDFPQLSEVNNSGVRVQVRKSIEPGQPGGMIVSAATSLWLPLQPQDVFNFFKDEETRAQWDILSNGNPVHKIAHVINGVNPGNCISLIRPFIPTENNILMIQESCTDLLGSLIVYAPIDIPALNVAIAGEDPSDIPILPSGFVISGDGRPSETGSCTPSGASSGRSGGSLLTVAFQILVSTTSSTTKDLNMEAVATVNTLISSTVQKIKNALNCSNLD